MKASEPNVNLNSEQLIKLVNWIEKITARMNNVANLFEKK
jgi:hypothetical protein